MNAEGRFVYSITAVTIVALVLLGILLSRMRDQWQMESLVAFVLDTGSPAQVSETALQYVGMSDDPTGFRELRVTSKTGQTGAIQVRKRESGACDVILLELLPNSNAGYFYLCDMNGRLNKAVYL